MKNNYFQRLATTARRGRLRGWLAAGGLLLGLGSPALAQTPPWALATATSARIISSGLYDDSHVNAVATDASGNVFVAGLFNGAVAFGSTTLSSAGNADFFVAKYVPATGTWAWAVRGGGTAVDEALGLTVSGNSVYLTGYVSNNIANGARVTLPGSTAASANLTQLGASTYLTQDLLVAKYTDQGSSATLAWAQVAGGGYNDQGSGIAVSGSSVYVAGGLINDASNSDAVVFGGSGSTLGTVAQPGISASSSSGDLLLAKYNDNGASAALAWTQLGGGTGGDTGYSVAVSGSSVYVAGIMTNNTSNAAQVVFGRSGTVAGTAPQAGATATNSVDMVLAKYTDNGATATFGWSQVSGGTDADYSAQVAVSGSSVYLTGFFLNDLANTKGALFGGSGLAVGTTTQLGASTAQTTNFLLAKYVDNGPTGTLGWTQVGGGTGVANSGHALAVSGTSVYVAGNSTNNTANYRNVVFGGSGTTPGTLALPGKQVNEAADLLVIKYLDQGSAATIAWAQLGGGTGYNVGFGLAFGGTRLYVAGRATLPATFGSLTTGSALSNNDGVLAALDLAGTPTATTPATAASLRLYPNPAAGAAVLSGAAAGTAVLVLDALGRRVAAATADATGTAALPAGLAPGVYVVRAGAGIVRWVVE